MCHLDQLLETRGMTLVELSEQVGVTAVNLSVLKNGRAEGRSASAPWWPCAGRWDAASATCWRSHPGRPTDERAGRLDFAH